MDDALNQAVRIATEEVFETFLGWKITSAAPVESTINGTAAETSVIISFVGNLSGAFTLKCSTKLATEIASQMLGTDIEASSDDMKDAVAEMLNMIAGAAKTKYSSGSDTFKISVPTIIIGGDYTIHIKADSDDKISLLEFRYNNDDMVIEIFLA